jgi:hypothetical protein
MLEALQELVGESCGFVEAEADSRMRRILSRVTLNLVEEPIHDDEMKVNIWIEAGTETMEEGAETFGYGEDPLADGCVGEDVIHQVGSRRRILYRSLRRSRPGPAGG